MATSSRRFGVRFRFVECFLFLWNPFIILEKKVFGVSRVLSEDTSRGFALSILESNVVDVASCSRCCLRFVL